jgi:metallo-beta-lactamase class B
VEPLRLFDNLYFVGLANVYAWVVDTPEGIIVLDTLNNAKDAEVTIVEGMKKLGLDPFRIKYVVISHAHADHFGGAAYLKEHYGARVLASDASWREMEQINAYVIGEEGFQRFTGWQAECLKADIARSDR